MDEKGRDARPRKGRDWTQVPVELLFVGGHGFVLLLVGVALMSETGDLLANAGLLVTLGSALWFFMHWAIARGVRE